MTKIYEPEVTRTGERVRLKLIFAAHNGQMVAILHGSH